MPLFDQTFRCRRKHPGPDEAPDASVVWGFRSPDIAHLPKLLIPRRPVYKEQRLAALVNMRPAVPTHARLYAIDRLQRLRVDPLVGATGSGQVRPTGAAAAVRVHDFIIPELGRAVPYGVYDIAGNAGWVSVGIDHDTASFAVNAIRRWWQSMGRPRYPTHAACCELAPENWTGS